jgi:hypothetical protein
MCTIFLTSSVKSRHGNYKKCVMVIKFGASTLLSDRHSMKIRNFEAKLLAKNQNDIGKITGQSEENFGEKMFSMKSIEDFFVYFVSITKVTGSVSG